MAQGEIKQAPWVLEGRFYSAEAALVWLLIERHSPLGGQVTQKRERLLYLDPESSLLKSLSPTVPEPGTKRLFFSFLHLGSPPRFCHASLLRWVVVDTAWVRAHSSVQILQGSQREVRPRIFRMRYTSKGGYTRQRRRSAGGGQCSGNGG